MKIKETITVDYLVIGSGIAGLYMSKKLADTGFKTLLATEGIVGGGASFFPLKGTLGIQTTGDNLEDKIYFQEDISNMGNKMDNPEMVKTYIEESPAVPDSLKEIGFDPWLRDDKRPACFAKYPRNIYLIKDWNGSREKAQNILNSYENLIKFEHSQLIKIFTHKGEVTGAILKKKDKFIAIKTKIIVLCTGGIAGLYKNKLYPKDIKGIGHYLALDAGAQLTNMEFIQFIPGFIEPKYNVLFGEHTAKYSTGLYDENMKKVLEGIDDSNLKKLWIERSSYAPFSFDFKSHLIDLKMMEVIEKNNRGVYIKFKKELYEDEGEFYRVYLNWLKNDLDIDMCRDNIMIAPFAHSCNGGIKIDINGKTDINGLYAIGEVASGIEGANRLGGNSVGGALVFGKRAVEHIENYLNNLTIKKYISNESIKNWIEGLYSKDGNDLYTSYEVEKKIKDILSKYGSIIREERNLNVGLEELKKLEQNFSLISNIELDGFETYYSLKMAQLLLTCMKNRKESRGSHYRKDYPYTENTPQKNYINKEIFL
ncbi:FAD-binding protein [Cetobacterium sp. SF1]|uniref:FAD-binding protein n=1 Tax=Cetobacterium sp. SF1 TaxID=3417654 RepID=UPI003CF65CBD